MRLAVASILVSKYVMVTSYGSMVYEGTILTNHINDSWHSKTSQLK